MNEWTKSEEAKLTETNRRKLEAYRNTKSGEPKSTLNKNKRILMSGGKALNTENLAREFNAVLFAENICKSVFASQVLGVTHSVMSKLVSVVKPWRRCSERKRAMYRKMYEWIRSAEAMRTLKELNETRPRRHMPVPNPPLEHGLTI